MKTNLIFGPYNEAPFGYDGDYTVFFRKEIHKEYPLLYHINCHPDHINISGYYDGIIYRMDRLNKVSLHLNDCKERLDKILLDKGYQLINDENVWNKLKLIA